MDKNIVHVEILCKSRSKTLFISIVKLCSFLSPHHISCVYLILSTHFYKVSHHVIHSLATTINNHTFPHFHTPYYYYYKIFININNNYRKDYL